jgi:1-acyl-sn-glycerol-3-phosphate acyltransferase
MLYRMLKIFFSVWLRFGHGLSIAGLERIPASGPLILCANHSSYYDAMLLGLCTRRPVRFMIIDDFYRHPLLGFFVRHCGAIPVTLRGGDREALRRGMEILRGGGVLGIFPEGRLTRTGHVGGGKPGVALLAAATGAPIVPVTISGAYGVYPRGRRFPRAGRIDLRVHDPVAAEPARRHDRAYLRDVTDRIMATIGGGLQGNNNSL